MSTLFDPCAYGIAEVGLVYKSKPEVASNPIIKSAGNSYAILLDAWNQNKIDLAEQCYVLLLNAANRVIGFYPMSSGGITSTVVDPRLCFIAALKANATKIILAHNHPSMNMRPSTHDTAITNQLKEAGKLLEISVLDHLIICRNGYYSFAEEEFSTAIYDSTTCKP